MKRTIPLVIFFLIGCGSSSEEEESFTVVPKPKTKVCEIVLDYDSTLELATLDLPRFKAKGYSDSCKEYLGANIQSLKYNLRVQAPLSVGRFDRISIDDRVVYLQNFFLVTPIAYVDKVDTSEVDNGPLQMQDIWMTFSFPKGAEKSLYPSEIRLLISK